MAKKILVVENSDILRNELKHSLEAFNYEVLETDCTQIGENINIEQHPDLVITNMNFENSIEFIHNVRTNFDSKATPIIMLVSENTGRKKIEGHWAGASGWVGLPLEQNKLMNVINRTL